MCTDHFRRCISFRIRFFLSSCSYNLLLLCLSAVFCVRYTPLVFFSFLALLKFSHKTISILCDQLLSARHISIYLFFFCSPISCVCVCCFKLICSLSFVSFYIVWRARLSARKHGGEKRNKKNEWKNKKKYKMMS